MWVSISGPCPQGNLEPVYIFYISSVYIDFDICNLPFPLLCRLFVCIDKTWFQIKFLLQKTHTESEIRTQTHKGKNNFYCLDEFRMFINPENLEESKMFILEIVSWEYFDVLTCCVREGEMTLAALHRLDWTGFNQFNIFLAGGWWWCLTTTISETLNVYNWRSAFQLLFYRNLFISA